MSKRKLQKLTDLPAAKRGRPSSPGEFVGSGDKESDFVKGANEAESDDDDPNDELRYQDEKTGQWYNRHGERDEVDEAQKLEFEVRLRQKYKEANQELPEHLRLDNSDGERSDVGEYEDEEAEAKAEEEEAAAVAEEEAADEDPAPEDTSENADPDGGDSEPPRDYLPIVADIMKEKKLAESEMADDEANEEEDRRLAEREAEQPEESAGEQPEEQAPEQEQPAEESPEQQPEEEEGVDSAMSDASEVKQDEIPDPSDGSEVEGSAAFDEKDAKSGGKQPPARESSFEAAAINRVLDEMAQSRAEDIVGRGGLGGRRGGGGGSGGGAKEKKQRERKPPPPNKNYVPGEQISSEDWAAMESVDEKNAKVRDFCPLCLYTRGALDMEGNEVLQDLIELFERNFLQASYWQVAHQCQNLWNDHGRPYVQEPEYQDMCFRREIIVEHFQKHIKHPVVMAATEVDDCNQIMKAFKDALMVNDSLGMGTKVPDRWRATMWLKVAAHRRETMKILENSRSFHVTS